MFGDVKVQDPQILLKNFEKAYTELAQVFNSKRAIEHGISCTSSIKSYKTKTKIKVKGSFDLTFPIDFK